MEIDASKHTVGKAIEKTIERGDKLDDLEVKAQNLEDQGALFHKGAKKARWNFFMQNLKIKILCGVSILVVLIIIIMIIVVEVDKSKDD